MTFTWRQKGKEVKELQLALMARGFELPKYGADGDLGRETWRTVEAFAGVDRFPINEPLPAEVTDTLLFQSEILKPEGYIRVAGNPGNIRRHRSWKDITTIVLHQTGVWMTDTPERFIPTPAHLAILKKHPTPIVQMHDLPAYLPHANELNSFSVGIEINGHFPGIIENFNSKRHTSEGPTPDQVENCRKMITWIMDETKDHGGQIKHILPHRVSNNDRRSDPGEMAWLEIGIWAQFKLGLCDFGAGYCIGDGTPIPREWEARRAYAPYRY